MSVGTLELPLSKWLHERRGVMDTQELGLSIAPETRLNVVTLAGRIGVAVAELYPEEPIDDRSLQLYTPDHERASIAALSEGLIIRRRSPLYKDARNKRVAILAELPLNLRPRDGVQMPDVGVALGPGEYTKIAHYPRPLAARARAVTLDARAGSNDREATTEASLRASGHILEDKLAGLEKLDAKLVVERALLLSIYRDARLIWRTAYLGKNLEAKRKQADELIQQTVEVAANSLNYGSFDTDSVHRAIFKRLYVNGSSAELANSWRSLTKWVAFYVNAKRGKVNQSMNGCTRLLRVYQPHLDKAKAA